MNALVGAIMLSNSLLGVALETKTPQVVYPRLLEQRTEADELVLLIHKDLILNMKKATVTSEKIRVITFQNEGPLTDFYQGKDVEKNLYEDRKQMAVISITSSSNGIQLEGVVGPYKRIEAVPSMERFQDGVMAHVLHDIEKTEMFDKELFESEIGKNAALVERNAAAQQTVPDSVLIEVFVVVDTHHHKHFSSREQLLTYVCIIVATANIRFAATRHPEVQLILTGLELNQYETFLATKEKYISGDNTLALFRNYAFANKLQYGSPDIAFLLTGRDTYTVSHGVVDTNLAGIAYIGAVCTEYYVGLGEDKPGSYSGIHVFTHEIAHVLGASHDGSPRDVNYPDKPDSLGCPWDLGHIMSYINKGPSHHHFSSCSLAQINYVVRLRGLVCWTVNSKQLYNITSVYPGMVVTPTAYCQTSLSDQRNVTADEVNPMREKCKVRCRYLKYEEIIYYGTKTWYPRQYYVDIEALEYTTCAEGKVCIQGACVIATKPLIAPTATPSKTTTTTTRQPTEVPTQSTSKECRCDCRSTSSTPYLPIRGPIR